MVKVIPTDKREILTNFEVFQLVSEHQEEQKAQSKGRKKANKAGTCCFTFCLFFVDFSKNSSFTSTPLKSMSHTICVFFVQNTKSKKRHVGCISNRTYKYTPYLFCMFGSKFMQEKRQKCIKR